MQKYLQRNETENNKMPNQSIWIDLQFAKKIIKIKITKIKKIINRKIVIFFSAKSKQYCWLWKISY